MAKKKTTKKQCVVCGDSGIMGDGHFTEYTPCNYCERGFMQSIAIEKKQEELKWDATFTSTSSTDI